MADEAPTVPEVAEDAIIQLLKNSYRLTVLQMKPLCGYFDKNYHVITEHLHENPFIDCIPCEGFFVKISNFIEFSKPESLYAQLAVMKHLRQKGFPCQMLVKNWDGEELTEYVVRDKHGTETVYMMSVREYLPGQVISTVTMTTRYLYDMGVFVARLSQGLQDFHNPFYDTFHHPWDFGSFSEIGKYVHVIEDKTKQRICLEVVKAFTEDVLPAKSGFRKGQIHGDLNDQNILVSKDMDRRETLDITGLIDLQDTTSSYLIHELAVCTCYMMMLEKLVCPRLDVPGHVLAGYTTLLELPEVEWKAFRILVAARMVISLVYGMYNYNLHPDDYYLLSSKTGWDSLLELWMAPSDAVEERWKETIASYKTA